MGIITLLTDFGQRDTYVGQMKGVIAGIAPAAHVVDLTHALPPQDVTVASIMLDAAVDAFPAGTIHVAVVDPGVGSQRQAIAIATERYTFVGPDNGLFTAVLERYPAEEVVILSNPEYQRRYISATFHGRDIFAPAAAHLSAGVSLSELGEPIRDIQTLMLPQPNVTEAAIEAHVLYADHFGNLITDLGESTFQAWRQRQGKNAAHLCLDVGPTRIGAIRRTFSDVPVGEVVGYFGSSGRLEIAVRNGSAARQFGEVDERCVRITTCSES